MAVKKLELIGKRWFDRKNGNTYFSAVALFNGNEIACIPFQYGYGDRWLYELLKVTTVHQYQIGGIQQPWQFIDFLESELGIAVFTNCIDVQRKRDL